MKKFKEFTFGNPDKPFEPLLLGTKRGEYFINFLEIKKVLNFNPVFINGPKLVRYSDAIYFDNNNRRVFFKRPKVNENLDKFLFFDTPC